MKLVRCLAMIISQIVICDQVGSVYRHWRHVRRETSCVTPRGGRGICLPPGSCGRHVLNGNSNYMSGHCKIVNGISTICCHTTRKWLYQRLIHPDVKQSLSSIAGETIRNSSIAVRYKRSFESVRPFSSASVSTPSSRSISNTSQTSNTSLNTEFLNSTVPFLSVLSPFANPGIIFTELLYTSNSNISTNIPDILSSSPTSLNASTESSTESPTTSSVTSSTSSSKDVKNYFAKEFPEPPECGVSQGSFSRVVGGNNANLGDFPWIALVAYHAPGGFNFNCGGSLITAQHILTAAHCIVGFEDSIYFVRVGEVDVSDHSQNQPIDILVKTMVAHEKYNKSEYTSDIGLLVLSRRIIFTDIIRPICLPLSKELRTKSFVDYRPFVAGWGRTSYRGPAATRLQMLQLPVVTQERCKEAYAVMTFLVIDERNICAGGTVGKDACNGDSGGPLMQPIWDPKNFTTYFYQTGIVSFGMQCGNKGFPAVYTRVSEFIPWIQKHVLGTDSL